MLLEPLAQYNDLSPDLRKELEKRIESFGDVVRYKFKIANENPDPEKYNGKTIYPRQYTLDPAKFVIRDEKEKREGKSKLKNIAMVTELDQEKAQPTPKRFGKIVLYGNQKGILELRIKKSEEDLAKCMMLELHPKNEDGMFPDSEMFKIFSRIDEKKYATEQSALRRTKRKAGQLAEAMSEAEVHQFNTGMGWDEARDISVMRNEIEEFAEINPEEFTKLVQSEDIKYRSVVQEALNKKKILFDPAEYKFTDATTMQVITVLSPNPAKTHVELMAEWLKTNGEKADKIYARLQEMLK